MSARSTPPLILFALRLFTLANRHSPKQNSVPTHDQGLSLIECLVAIIVITITLVAITPPVFLATASRIQSRRAEQANQIAQKEIDRVRGVVERGNYTIAALPASVGVVTPQNFPNTAAATSVDTSLLSSTGTCPGITVYPQATPTATGSLIPVDVDGDCQPDYIMQVFRSDGCVPQSLIATPPAPPTPPYSFWVGVRIYTYVPGETLPTLSIERATLALTTGRRDSAANTRKPLQTIYTKLSRSNSSKALECAAQ